MARDGISAAQAKQKIDSQMSIEQKKSLAHHVIDNSTSMAFTRKQTENLIRDSKPPAYSTVIMWMIFFWPALMLYFFLVAYNKIDTFRYVGVLNHRPIPKVIKSPKLGAAPAAK